MIEGDIPKEIYEEKKRTIKRQMDYCDKEIDKLSIEDSGTCASNLKIDYLLSVLDSIFDGCKGKIPDELIEAFVDRIVVHQDYYEWRLKRLDLPLRCKVTGRRNNQTVEFIEDEKTSEPSLQYRLQLQKENKKKTIEKPLKLGTFTIGKEYLNEYKKYHPETKKVNSWKDLVFDISINGI